MDNKHFFIKSLSLVFSLALIVVLSVNFNLNHAYAGTASTITVDTASNNGTVNPFLWGVGAPDKYTWWPGNANLKTSVSNAKIKIVRVGPTQLMKYNGRDPYPAANTWSFPDMDSILNTIFDAGAEPLFIVCGFPNGVPNTRDSTGLITSANWTEYANFMKGVVKRYNTDKVLGATRTVKYWEMWNEPTIEGDGKFASQAEYKTFAQTVGNAMKLQDSTIKLIASADAWSNLSTTGYTSFAAKNLESQIDILSWHDYGQDPTHSDATRMAWTKPHYQDNIVTVKSGGAGNIFKGPSGKLYGAAITEYNMSHQDGGATYNAEYHNEFNAVYAASSIVNAMQGNADIFSFYNLAETGTNLLGLLDNKTYAPYKPYYTFHLFGNHFGNQKLTTTGESTNLEFVASKDTVSGKTYVVVVNKDMSVTYDATINLNNISNASGSVAVWKLDATTNPTSSATASYASSQFTYSIPPKTVISFEISPTPTPTPLPGSTKFEAENAALNIARITADHLNYSGKGFVDNYVTASVGASTTFTINAVSAGASNVDLRYANATGISRTLSIYVNGVKIKQTTLATLANWDTWGDQVESLTLNAGNNTIAYKYDAGDTANVNLDYISLLGAGPTPTPTPTPLPGSTKFEAENAALNIARITADHLNYSGKGFVDNYVTASVGASTTFTINAVSSGASNVDLRYANATGISRTLSIYVNGVKIKQTTLATLANWDTWGDQVESLTLNAGNNTIAYKYDAGDTANVNLDYISFLGSTPTPTPTPGGTLFSTGFERSDPQPTWLDTIEQSLNVSGYISGISPECSPRQESTHTGISTLMYSGTDNSTVISYANYKVFNVNIPITANTKLSYWINPQQDNGRYVGIDFIMTDGTTLRDSGAVDYNGHSMHPNAGHGGAILINTWTQIKSKVGQWLTGKTIARITVNYDRPPNTGQYRGYIDDILITNGTLP